jgi:hypothetical protein
MKENLLFLRRGFFFYEEGFPFLLKEVPLLKGEGSSYDEMPECVLYVC